MNTRQDYLERLAKHQNTPVWVNGSAPALNLMQTVLGVPTHCCQHWRKQGENCSSKRDYNDRPCQCRLSARFPRYKYPTFSVRISHVESVQYGG